MNNIKKLLLNQGKTETIEGVPPLTLERSLGKDLKDYNIYGDSVQNGTPTPEKPIEIESVGDKTVNLADMSKTTNENFVDNGDGSFTLTKMSNSKRFSEEIFPNIPANTTFYIKAKILEYTGTYSQKLQLLVHLEDGSTKYINNATDDIQGKYTYTSAVKDIRIYSDGSNPDGTIVTFKDFIISTEDVPYEPYNKYKIPVVSKGINLIDYRTFESRNQSLYPLKINDDGSLEYTGNYYITANGSFMEKGKTYVFDYKYESDINPLLRLQYTDNTYTASFRAGNTVTVTKDVKFIMIYTDFTDVIHYLKIWDLMLVEGTTTKDYEPYVEPVKTKIFLDEPLRKIGDYADYIDFVNGKVVRNIKTETYNGSEEWIRTIYGTNPYYLYRPNISFLETNAILVVCNCFKGVSHDKRAESGNNIVYADNSYEAIYIRNTTYATLEDFKAFLRNNNITVNYVLVESLEEDIKLPNIPTTKGTTIIELDTKINASNMMTKYKRR